MLLGLVRPASCIAVSGVEWMQPAGPNKVVEGDDQLQIIYFVKYGSGVGEKNAFLA